MPLLKLQSSRALLGLALGWLPGIPADVVARKWESCKRRALAKMCCLDGPDLRDYPEFGSNRELNKVSKVALPESLLRFKEAQKYFLMSQSLPSQALKPERGCITCSALLQDSLQLTEAQLHTIGVGIHPPESISSMLRNCIEVGNHQLQQCGICRNL